MMAVAKVVKTSAIRDTLRNSLTSFATAPSRGWSENIFYKCFTSALQFSEIFGSEEAFNPVWSDKCLPLDESKRRAKQARLRRVQPQGE
jgi:hypothetical protein